MATSFLGTRGYLAPEMIQRRDYTKSVDAWALGVIIFVLLCGCLPFDDDCQLITNSPDLRTRFTLRFPRWAKDLSPSAKDLLGRLLTIDHGRRYTAEQAMDHPWVRGETASRDSLLQSPGRLRPSPGGGKNGGGKTTANLQATKAHVSQMVANRAIANAQIAAGYRSPGRQHVRKSSI
jgi:serine/threonine protein kinase